MTTVLERAGAPSADVGFKTPPAYVREWAQDHPDRVAMREKDYTTMELFEDILAEEEEHHYNFKTLLA